MARERTPAIRELARHRVTLVAIGLLLILGTSPVYAHHIFSLGGAQLLAGMDHIGTLCLTALHLLLQPVHSIFHVVLLAGVAYAVWDRARAWRALRRTLSMLEQRIPDVSDVFGRACATVGVDPSRVRIVRGLPNPAFTVGLLRPRVYLAAELATGLARDELLAVLAHEGVHVRRRDPLRLFLLRLLACTLFWIPALRRLAEDMSDEAELLADDVAVRGEPLALASAILALANWSAHRNAPPLAVGFRQDALLERRIRRLVGEDVPARRHVTRRSLLSAGLALSLVWSSGVLMAHPLPNEVHRSGHEVHCEHDGAFALAHLFCLGSPFGQVRHEDCPHRVPDL